MIKTRIQVSKTTEYSRHWLLPDGGFIDCAKQIYKTRGGFMGFWTGFKACAYRAVVVGAVKFVVYDQACRF